MMKISSNFMYVIDIIYLIDILYDNTVLIIFLLMLDYI